jgi:hypothetical protein
MSIKNRVEKLERAMPTRGGNRTCNSGSPVIRVYRPGDAEDPTPAGMCGMCGGERKLINIQVVYTREQLQEVSA